MTKQLRYFDGAKNIDLSTISTERWEELFGVGSTKSISDPVSAWTTLGWVNRCVSIRANSVAFLPWSIMKGDKEIARSDEYNYPMPWMNKIGDFLHLSEASLSITSQAYIYKSKAKTGKIVDLQWFSPFTMAPVWEGNKISSYKRQGYSGLFDSDEIVYTRMLSPIDEIGHAPSPVETALSDANVLININSFASQFFQRGAIKAMLLSVEGNPSPEEIKKLEVWWKRWFKGIQDAWQTAAIRAGVKPIVVGEGISELSNRELTDEKREAISTALGVPHSLVMSNAANYATAQADRLNFYDMTVLPQARLIQRAWNAQLFEPIGLRFIFRPQALPIYQSDEREASETIRNLAQAGVRPSHALLMLGREIPTGIDPDEFDKAFLAKTAEKPQDETFDSKGIKTLESAENASQPVQSVQEGNTELEQEKIEEIKAFRRWLKNNPNRLGRLEDFSAEYLTEHEKEDIASEIKVKQKAENHSHKSIRALQLDNPEIDPELSAYEDSLQALIGQALNGEINRADFRVRLEEIAKGAMTTAFLIGLGNINQDDLDTEQFVELGQIMRDVDKGVDGLTEDVFSGRYEEEDGIERAFARTGLWVTAMAAAFHTAITLQRENNKRYEWVIGATQESCPDCLRLSGQIHTSSQWRNSRWSPQSGRLECGGWNCDCRLVETDEPERGEF